MLPVDGPGVLMRAVIVNSKQRLSSEQCSGIACESSTGAGIEMGGGALEKGKTS